MTNKDPCLAVRMTPEMYASLEKLRQSRGHRSLNSMVRALIDEATSGKKAK